MDAGKRPKHKPTGPSGPSGVSGVTAPLKDHLPHGPVPGYANLDWGVITQYAKELRQVEQETGVPASRLAAHLTIESEGNRTAIQRNPTNGDSYGLMQIVPYGVDWEGWHSEIARIAGVPDTPARVINALYDPLTSIRVAAEILKEGRYPGETWDQASSRYFVGNPNWAGGDYVNGTTAAQYRDKLNGLIREWEKAAGPIGPTGPTGPTGITSPTGPTPEPEKPVTEDSILKLIGGPHAYVSFAFNEPNYSCGNSGTEPCHFYSYGVGHGCDSDINHTGNDIAVPLITTIRTPLAGEVTCVGIRGNENFGQSCGYFADDGGGIGNITVMTTIGIKLTFGHMRSANVTLGQKVKAGDVMGTSGSGNSFPHCHLDVVTCEPARVPAGEGCYYLHDPLPFLQHVMQNGTLPVTYANPRPVPQPDSEPPYVVYESTIVNLPVLQRGYADSDPVRAPLKMGEQVTIQHQLAGDKGWYGVDIVSLGRIPMEGLKEVSRRDVRKPGLPRLAVLEPVVLEPREPGPTGLVLPSIQKEGVRIMSTGPQDVKREPRKIGGLSTEGPMGSEPALSIAAIMAAIAAVIAILSAFGIIHWTPEQKQTLLDNLPIIFFLLVAIIAFVQGAITRSRVFAPKTVARNFLPLEPKTGPRAVEY